MKVIVEFKEEEEVKRLIELLKIAYTHIIGNNMPLKEVDVALINKFTKAEEDLT